MPKTERARLADLKPAPWNPRYIRPEARARLVKSIERFGLVQPIVVNADNTVLGGHQRLDVQLEKGVEEDDIIRVDLSPTDARALSVALNDRHAQGEFTPDVGDLLRELEEEDAALFESLGLDRLLKETEAIAEAAAAREPPSKEPPEEPAEPPEVEPVTKPGEVIELGPHRLHCVDCVEMMRGLEDSSAHAVVTDPPYLYGFMSKDWDKAEDPIAWHARWTAEAFRVCKPGAHLVAFSSTTMDHHLKVALEQTGWELRDTLGWVTYQGFPKSLDVSKAIDAHLGKLDERDVVGERPGVWGKSRADHKWGMTAHVVDTAPATPEAAKWQGWGTALKPAIEPFVLARKPLEGTVAENVLKWGTGALNIDACRFAPGDPAWVGPTDDPPEHPLGRWPANLYYCPKPSTGEREAGCEESGAGHPTVKPTKLMRWLLMLVSPPGAIVLEPFAGSGSTIVAAEGLDLTIEAAEREPSYCDIARARYGAVAKASS